jgi:hypothetical protein
MFYELRPGWHRPVERFEVGQERALGARWEQVYRNRDSGVWRVEATGARWGTREPGEVYTGIGGPTGRWLDRCLACGREFWMRKPYAEQFCPGCFFG